MSHIFVISYIFYWAFTLLIVKSILPTKATTTFCYFYPVISNFTMILSSLLSISLIMRHDLSLDISPENLFPCPVPAIWLFTPLWYWLLILYSVHVQYYHNDIIFVNNFIACLFFLTDSSIIPSIFASCLSQQDYRSINVYAAGFNWSKQLSQISRFSSIAISIE